jgi:hypothetical protein
MQFRLRTLLLWAGIAPALLAGWWFIGVEWHKDDDYGFGLIAFGIISFGLLLSLWNAVRNPWWDEP